MSSVITRHSKTIRLATSYITIIMILSVSFSVIFYKTSTSTLGNGPGIASVANELNEPAVGRQNQASSHQDGGPLADLDDQLQQKINAIGIALKRKLIMLNIGAFVVGGILSYALARRTLRPIEAAMDAQSRFASEASHELRTPLAVMQAENERALRTQELTPAARLLIKSNLEEITHLKALSEDLLRLAREDGRLSLIPVWLDEAAALAIRHMAKRSAAKRIIVHNTAPHVQVLADEQSLVQAIVILLENAVQYSYQGGPIYLEGLARGSRVHLSVRDEGPGIAKKDLGHIFDRFYRAKTSRQKHPQGNGLGLAIAKKLVGQQRGRITAQSILGQGATFTIELATTT